MAVVVTFRLIDFQGSSMTPREGSKRHRAGLECRRSLARNREMRPTRISLDCSHQAGDLSLDSAISPR